MSDAAIKLLDEIVNVCNDNDIDIFYTASYKGEYIVDNYEITDLRTMEENMWEGQLTSPQSNGHASMSTWIVAHRNKAALFLFHTHFCADHVKYL